MPDLRVWSPLRSALRIEYSRDLLRELIPRDQQVDVFGVLYGSRTSGSVRVLAAQRTADLVPVGVFAARVRGEVFLTENDIERLEALENPGAIALVIAGEAGGFFVRESDGSMQTIKSYQEFPVRAPAPKSVRAPKSWFPLALPLTAASAVLTVLAWPSRAYSVHEQDGQLRIDLRSAARSGATLEIVDGKGRRVIPITPFLTSVVYTPATHDVRINILR